MTSTEESTLLDVATEFDSESSSSDDRGTNKRGLGTDLECTGPKKRRKQTTPVRFPVCLTIAERRESEDDDEDDPEQADPEGKTPQSPEPPSNQQDRQCHLCGQSFDDKAVLNQHLECEHFVVAEQSNPIPIKTELDVNPFAEQAPTSPVNLSSISIKNFATWVPSQPVNKEPDWPPGGNPVRLSIPEHIQGLPPFPAALTQYLHYPGFPLSDASQMPPRPSIGPVPPRIFNRDAYCDLCNKEFCNKYFLKTHKANKHGIYSDNSSQSSIGDTVAVGPALSQIKTEPQRADDSATSPFSISPKPGFSCDICQRRFKSEDLVRKHKQKVHEEPFEQMDNMTHGEEKRDIISSQSPSVMEMLFKQEYGVEQEEQPAFAATQKRQLMTESGLSIEHLRKLGVISAETFCEACCKEFVNKFYLRAHKLKRHGLFVPDGDEKSPPTWHHVQTSPLNLIVNETANSSESAEPDEHECRVCGIHFQTAELHDVHRQRVHDEKPKSPNNDADTSNHKTDSISEDLQKLQTMILQLNGLEPQKKDTVCTICGAEFETKALLHSHMNSEHEFVSENPSTPNELEKSPGNSGIIFCTICEKELPGEEALKKHLIEEHPPTSVSLPQLVSTPMPVSTTPKPTAPQADRKPLTSMTPTSSYCEICNKELCNKYFMKTHMHRMHGIEISNGAQIGGVICNICNKELCSKYFLRVHKHNTHGIVDESSSPAQPKQDSFDASSSEDNSLKPDHPGDLSNRYFSHFTEVCPICSRRFRSVKWLKAHLLGDHGKAGVDKWREFEEQYPVTRMGSGRTAPVPRPSQPSPGLKIPNGQDIMQNKIPDFATLGTQVLSNLFGTSTDDQRTKGYRCSLCNFTTTALPFLFLHERTHANPSGDQSLQCPICSQGFPKLELLHHHLLSSHQFPNMLSQFPAALNNFSGKESKENALVEAKLPETNQPAYGLESESYSVQKPDQGTVEVTPLGAYKCSQCGFASTNLNRIKKHVKKEHKSAGDVADSVIAELSRTLKEIANKHKLPASYAMPQDMNSNADKTVMQPFLIEEYEGTDELKRFAPALVYLPVKARVNAVITASFTLSPA